MARIAVANMGANKAQVSFGGAAVQFGSVNCSIPTLAFKLVHLGRNFYVEFFLGMINTMDVFVLICI